MVNVIETKNLSKVYGDFRALSNVNINIKQGEIYGLIGRNGAGKTTFLKILTNLIHKSEGKLKIFGSENIEKELRRVGSVIETPVAIENLTAYENLKYYALMRGISNKDQVINEVLELVGLSDTGKKKFKSFSLGMKQRLGIAIALLSRPDFLILDEPLNGLDPLGIAEMRRMIVRLNEEYNMTIIISSHILSELYHVGTKFGIINDGKLIKEFTKDDFEKMNKNYIVFKTDMVEAASRVLRDNNFSFKVVNNDKELNIFTAEDELDALVRLFVRENIKVEGIYYEKEDLENYFTKLVSEVR